MHPRTTFRFLPPVATGPAYFVPVALAALLSAKTSTALQGAAADGVGPRGSRAETANYEAEIAAAGSYKAGSEGVVKVTMLAKGGYHINPQYPYKFKAAAPAPDGISFPKPVLQRSDGTFEEMRGSFQVPFVAAKAGKIPVGGTLYLSVCSAANCVVDKVPLEITVDVK